MEFPERISEKITKSIANTLTDLSEEKLEQINYGIAVSITNSYKGILLFVLAYLLGVFKWMLIGFFSFGFLRTFASGLHAKKEWTCLLSTLGIFFGIVYLALHLNFTHYHLVVIYPLCFLGIIKFAPADNEEKPIVSKRLRKNLKVLSGIAVGLLFIIAWLFCGTPVANIVTVSVMVESVMVLPVTYKIFGRRFGTGLIDT